MDSERTGAEVTVGGNPRNIQGNTLINAIADWLMQQALGSTTAEPLLTQCSVRLDAAGIPLYRSSIGFQILPSTLSSGLPHLVPRRRIGGAEPICWRYKRFR